MYYFPPLNDSQFKDIKYIGFAVILDKVTLVLTLVWPAVRSSWLLSCCPSRPLISRDKLPKHHDARGRHVIGAVAFVVLALYFFVFNQAIFYCQHPVPE